jgi:hypothetical protein
MSTVPNNTPPGQLPITKERLLDVIAKSNLSTTSNGCYGQICTLKVSNAPTGTIRALTRTEAFFTFNPLGRGLKGAWSIVPGTIDLVKEGALAVNDGVGATVYTGLNAATGSNIPYESSGALGQSIQQEGVLVTTGKLVHGVVTNLPGIGLINGLYRGNPEMTGSGAVGAVLGSPLLKRGGAAGAGETASRTPARPTSSPRSQPSSIPPPTPKKPGGVAVIGINGKGAGATPARLNATFKGKTIEPAASNETLYHGNKMSWDEIVEAKGLPEKGTNTDLLNHLDGGENSAFRGTTRSADSPLGDGNGPVGWAGEGGTVVKIDGTRIPNYDTNAITSGQIQRYDGRFVDHRFIGEAEFPIHARVPIESISHYGVVVEVPRGLRVTQWIENPYYKK